MAKFVKGQSGNPGGRPKGEAKVREAAQAAGPKALAVLVDALKDDDARVRIKAAEILLDRGFGRPAQAITGAEGGPVAVTFAWQK